MSLWRYQIGNWTYIVLELRGELWVENKNSKAYERMEMVIEATDLGEIA